MANIKSAKKRIKTTERNSLRNKATRSEVKTLRKQAETALQKNTEGRDALLQKYLARVDSAVSKGVFHRNKAARLKSQILTKVKKTAKK
ncbi:30S ribosomal protein S20 [Candidatus Termititenax persephonae]|uniref:Small ribosomal subunit protein bS20 n=1 Tax=Candidatus Termititenax persephonae TaxID=2218525 RepID=A0A388TGY4_9BACT|nr:30S ribosomal protein S20 [Candidatus Termititenax persephonae]